MQTGSTSDIVLSVKHYGPLYFGSLEAQECDFYDPDGKLMSRMKGSRRGDQVSKMYIVKTNLWRKG